MNEHVNTFELYQSTSQIDLTVVCLCFVDFLSFVISKTEIDTSLLTVLAMAGYSTLFESMIQIMF